MQIKTLSVDFTGKRALSSAIELKNGHVDSLIEMQKASTRLIQSSQFELESVDNEVIAYAIQEYKDEEVNNKKISNFEESTSTVSVFINDEFYKDFELHAAAQVVHTANLKEEE